MKRVSLLIIAFSIAFIAVLIFNAVRRDNKRWEDKADEEAKNKLVLRLTYIEIGLLVIYLMVYFINV